MRAYGSDRVRPGHGESISIHCRRTKGWNARVPRTMTSAEYPGTAVLWEDRYYEVLVEEPLPDGGWRYVLEPWPDSHVMRVSDAYDEASESRREAEHRAALVREKGRRTANLLGVFTGHLPAVVQQQLASELGIMPARLTLLSLTLPVLAIVLTLQWLVRSILERSAGPPLWLLILCVYLALETVIRFHVVWSQSRPIGSAAGLLVYSIGYALGLRHTGAVSPTAVERGTSTFTLPPDEATVVRDAVATRSAFMTLLSAAEQRVLAQRYGFDYRADATTVAAIILVFAVIGVVSSAAKLSDGGGITALLSLLLAAALTLEQLVRLPALRRGPAGSFMAFLVRPFVRKLLR
ncbi:MAG TPA: hypothetical protein VMS98_08260 [Thermoanaerobaculia bacterium]|nr:hypothetical protein [Thermoanaerobaculia bacterium]